MSKQICFFINDFFVFRNTNFGLTMADSKLLQKSKRRNTALIIEDTPVYINKNVLSAKSPVFEALFSTDGFIECNKDEITLPGKNLEEFVHFLSLFCPVPRIPITRWSV